jgi:hypothetical protein
MSAAFSGAYSNVQSGTLDMDTQGWSADPEINTFDSTTTADAGWDDTTGATSKISGSFDFLWNPSKKPSGATAALTPGATPTLTLYVNKLLNPGDILTGKALITKLSLKAKVKDGFTVTVSFTSKGAWVYPS